MFRRTTVAVLAIVASLAFAAAAQGANYMVTGTGDSASPDPCTPDGQAFTCTTLRAAVNLANQDVDSPTISFASPGTVTLTAGPLDLQAGTIDITGLGPLSTVISGNDSSTVFTVEPGVDATLALMTIRDGTNDSGNGGNISVRPDGQLLLGYVHVTGGSAARGAGVANAGELDVLASLFDGNVASTTGGAIYDAAIDGPASTTVVSSTLAANSAPSGAAISVQNADLDLELSTIGRNLGGSALELAGAGNLVTRGSIIADNGSGNCHGAVFNSDSTFSFESGSDCGLTGSSNRQNNDAGLAAALSDQGGQFGTPVLTIPADSPAVDFVNPCLFPIDQRGAPRYTTTPTQACDAGAYERSGAVGQPPAPPAPAPPPPPPPVPTPTPTPVPSPTPVPNKTVVVEPTKGTVLLCSKPGVGCKPITAGEAIPTGSTLDLKKGTIKLTSIPKPGAPPETATFKGAIVKITQSHRITNLTLTEPLAACPKHGSASAAKKKKKKPRSRRRFGDGKGSFRTTGRYSAATIRATKWSVQDSCAGTLTPVTRGVVAVRDNVRKKTFIVRKGHKHLARPRK
jgi:hypothetical protein